MKRRDPIFALLGILLIIVTAICLAAPKLKQHWASAECGNRMTSVGIGALIWAGDNGRHLPADFLCLSNELCLPEFLICPSDKVRQAATNWSSFTTNNCSYEILRPNLPANDFTNAYFRCTIHGHLGYADGTVFDGHRRRTKTVW